MIILITIQKLELGHKERRKKSQTPQCEKNSIKEIDNAFIYRKEEKICETK